ncbi:MAG: hypothetical protein ACK4OM_02525 [Alphaproteobacteria bacterium]
MSALIIDQLLNLIKKTKKIIGWSRDEEQDKDEKHIPRIPIILNTKPGAAIINTENSLGDSQNGDPVINPTPLFWTKATVATEKKEKLSSKILQKFARRFKKGQSRKRSRGA